MVMFGGPRGDRALKMFLVAGEIIMFRTMDARAKQVAHFTIPSPSYSSLIAISFPELSLAFSMLKVARIDAKVNHNYSDGVTSALRKYNEYQRLRLQRALQHKLCVVVRMNLRG